MVLAIPSHPDYDAVESAYSTSGHSLPDHIAVFRRCPGIAKAMGFSSLPSDVQTGFWDACNTASVSGPANPAAPASVGTGTYADLTRDEVTAYYEAKAAHAIQLEVDATYPWRLHNMRQVELEALFDPSLLFEIWDPDGAIPGRYRIVVDHSPQSAYTIATREIAGYTSMQDAARLLFNYMTQYRHSAAPPDDVSSATLATLDTPVNGDYISRTGCHCAGRLYPALLRAVNIPARPAYGYFGGGGHCSSIVYINGIGYLLGHGDDVYGGTRFQWRTSPSNVMTHLESAQWANSAYDGGIDTVVIEWGLDDWNTSKWLDYQRSKMLYGGPDGTGWTTRASDSGFSGLGWDYVREQVFFDHSQATVNAYNKLANRTGSDGGYPAGWNGNPGDFVLSMEYFKIPIPAGSGASGAPIQQALTQGQTAANCVPFVTVYATTPNGKVMQGYAVDAWVSGSTLNLATTTSATRALTAFVTIVEFDPAKVRVQSGTFSIPSLVSGTATLGQAVDQTRTFIHQVYRVTSADHYQAANVRASFNSNTEILFDRGDITLTQVNGHYYAIEALNGEFSVQAVDVTIADATSSNTGTIPVAVDTTKTAVFGSYKSADATASNANGTADISLTNGSTITVQRAGTVGALTGTFFVVEFAGGVTVRHGALLAHPADAIENQILSPPVVVNESLYLFTGALNHFHSGSFPGSADADVPDAMVLFEPQVSGVATIRKDVSGGEADNDITWQVIEW